VRSSLQGRALPVVLGGAAAVAGYQILFFSGVRALGVTVGTLVTIGCAPVLAGLLGLFLRERMSRRWGLATGIVIGGLVLLLLPGQAATITATGVLLALGAGFSYAAYTVLARLLLSGGTPGSTVVGLFFGIGALALVVVRITASYTWLLDGRAIATVLWVGVMATALPYWLWIRGLARVQASTAATVSLAEPLVASLLAITLLGESMTVLGGVGIGIIVLGMSLIAKIGPSLGPDVHDTEEP